MSAEVEWTSERVEVVEKGADGQSPFSFQNRDKDSEDTLHPLYVYTVVESRTE